MNITFIEKLAKRLEAYTQREMTKFGKYVQIQNFVTVQVIGMEVFCCCCCCCCCCCVTAVVVVVVDQCCSILAISSFRPF